MKIPTVTQCCCCVQLRTAGLILGGLGVVFLLVELFEDDFWWKRVYLSLILVFEALWIAGILKEKPNWMLPSLIASIIEQIVLLLSPLFLPTLTKYFVPELYDLLNKNEHNYTAAYIFICVMLYLALAFSAYIFIVCYSLYKQIKDKLSTEADPNIVNSMRYDP